MLETIIKEKNIDANDYPLLFSQINNLGEQETEYLLSLLKGFNRYAYNCGSVIHGVYHAEKVFFFTFILSRNIPEPYRKILLDAAFYHDIGRQNNCEDTIHGFGSSNLVEKYLKDDLYKSLEKKVILKALLEAHCKPDSESEYCFKNVAYDLELADCDLNLTPEVEKEIGIYLELIKVLKDADALDRKRFFDISIAALNPNLLRIEESKNLVELSKELNLLYLELMKSKYVEINEDNITPGDCYHTVGFDFFKINSILKYGVLSQDEMKKNMLSIPRNFTGGNFDRWISVVDISLVKEGSTAIRNFINHGVSFYCAGVKMHPPLPHDQRTKALEQGLPWNKSFHEDERYVYGSIGPDKLKKIIIPEEYVDKNIREVTYLYNSLEIEIIKSRVDYYIKQTSTDLSSPYCQALNQHILEYQYAINTFLALSTEERKQVDIYNHLNPILEKINKQIANMVYDYYAKYFSQDKIDNLTVKDIVLFELSKNDSISFTHEESNGSVVITLGTQKAKKIY